jgi:hypothetical protein
VSALAHEPLDFAAPLEGSTRARRERLRLVPTLRPHLVEQFLPQELLDTWDRALTAADGALVAAESMKVFAPDELRRRRQRLHEERRWLMLEGDSKRAGVSRQDGFVKEGWLSDD